MAKWLVTLTQALSLLLSLHPLLSDAYKMVYALNCGGQKFTDSYGVRYKADTSKVGIVSEFGKTLAISRTRPEDMGLYQTERYHTSSFSYEVPIKEDGEYVLILKFSEVYFTFVGGKVFDVMLNHQHPVVHDLDIFAKVGKAVAHDEVVSFSVENGQLTVGEDSSDFDGTLNIEFSKGSADNPKCNAIVVLKGPVDPYELPALPPIQEATEPLDMDSDTDDLPEEEKENTFKRTSGPKIKDPYASDESWFMPITIAIAVFLPVLFCLCRVR